MLNHYFKTASRILMRHKVYSLIDILGLAIGLACSILILLYVKNELNYNRFHKNFRNIYRVNVAEEQSGQMTTSAIGVAAIGPSMRQDFPEVVGMTRISNDEDGYFTFGDKHIFSSHITYADSSFFKIFSFEMLNGNPLTALVDANSVVLSKDLSEEIFGIDNPVGQTLKLNNETNLRVTGIAESPPKNSSIQYRAIISFITLEKNPNVFLDWDGGWNYFNFVELTDKANLAELESKFPDFLQKNINYKYKEVGIQVHLMLQPLKDIHLHSTLDYDTENSGSPEMINILSAIAIFILLIACINFMNLATARSVKRAKEVGLRKVVGASRGQIILQFLGESVTTSFTALVGAVILIEIFQPEFNRLVNADLHLFSSHNFLFLAGILLLTFAVGILAGSYPSFFMAAYQPAKIIQGDFNVRSGKPILRNVLVVFQFFVSSVLILFTLLVYAQLKYINKKDLGYNKENVVYVNLHDAKARQGVELLKMEFRTVPGVISAGASTGLPGHDLTMNGYFPEGYEEPTMIHALDVDYDFLDVMNIPVVAGRTFSKESALDADAFIINQTLAKKLNWADPVGKKIMRDGTHPVIGMVGDFNFSSLHSKIEPLLITLKPWDGYYYLVLRLTPGDPQKTIAALEKKWNDVLLDQPFSFGFLDSYVSNAYDTENKIGKTFLYFSLLAIFIACLGLFGLANYAGEHKRKEIGIRKVFGAASGNILSRLSSDYTKWVILANILAWPLAYWAMDTWLQLFEYRTGISAWIFIATFLITSFISLLTVLYQVIHAARTNPVDTLKYE